MKTAKRWSSVAVLSGLICFTSTSAQAGENKGATAQRGGGASTHMTTKGTANTNAQWSADPEKGWVRAEERHKLQHDKKAKQNSSKKKGKETTLKEVVGMNAAKKDPIERKQ